MTKHLSMPIRFRFLRVPTTWDIDETRWPGMHWGKISEEGKPTELDGWACRDEFFRLPREKRAYLDFLNRVGWWSPIALHREKGFAEAPAFKNLLFENRRRSP